MPSVLNVDTLVAANGTDPVTLTKQSAAKMWIDFAGDGSSINGSFNIASLTDNAAGDYTPNFSSSMSNANYAITTSGALRPSDSGISIVLQIRNIFGNPTLKTTSAIRIDGKRSDTDTNLDIGTGCASVNGDLA
jgi:hypothetical protein